MAGITYSQVLDNMVSTAIETYTKDPANLLTDSGEKFHMHAAQKGRLFVINDAETVRHPFIYDHGEDTSLYEPDTISGDPAVGTLGTAAKEVITQALFFLQAGTRNINFPQSQPPGNLIDYVTTVVEANMMSILNQEEIMFVQGDVPGSSGTFFMRGPLSVDTGYVAGYPMSLLSLLYGSAETSFAGDISGATMAGVETDIYPKWHPTQKTATATDHSTLLADMQNAIYTASYSGVERPTDVYMAQESHEKFLSLHRAFAALPDPVHANIGHTGAAMPFGGVNVDWSRYLEADVGFDVVATVATTATYPILGINWNSLRLNTVRAGSPSDGNLGFIRQIGDMQVHAAKTNWFKRIEWKRQWSVDKGRRSFFTVDGNLTIA